MSAREVHVRIARILVDAPLRAEVDRWAEAIGHALQQRLIGAVVAVGAPALMGSPDVIAQRVATRITDPNPSEVHPARMNILDHDPGADMAANGAVPARGKPDALSMPIEVSSIRGAAR